MDFTTVIIVGLAISAMKETNVSMETGIETFVSWIAEIAEIANPTIMTVLKSIIPP